MLYGGRLERYRILSANRRIQYLFFSGPLQVWIIPPQATTTVLSSFGVRTVDVVVDDDLCCPGYEYHFLDDTVDPPEFYSQIPEGYAGDGRPPRPVAGRRVAVARQDAGDPGVPPQVLGAARGRAKR